jgi:NAD(P)-dependent dehydrogenase (short-subunit alcohol dehydrogenase family)
MALALAGAGAKVAVTGRDRSALDETIAQIRITGGDVDAYALDVTSQSAVDAFAAAAWKRFGAVDVVFANAGISDAKPSLETTDAEILRLFDANALGTFRTLRSFARLMLERGSGKLITLGSDVGLRGVPEWLAYGVSKAAIVAMTKTLAWEWAPKLTVNCIAPGAFATDMNAHLLSNEAILRGLQEITPLRRVGNVDEIGPLAVYLAGSGSDFMTGQVISIDGGIQRS